MAKQQRNAKVIEVPAACPRCKSVDRTRTHSHRFPNRPLRVAGQTYPGRIVRRVKCDHCGCRYVISAPIGQPNGTESEKS